MYDSMLSCREREEDEWEFFFQRKFWQSWRGPLSDSNYKEYVVCKFWIRMQIQIQNIYLSTNSNSKNTKKSRKGAPVDFCSNNWIAHFFQPSLVFQHSSWKHKGWKKSGLTKLKSFMWWALRVSALCV
jgi:hypothetical protein